MVSQLLGALVVALVVSVVASMLALKIFPWFRSGERKEGHFRADQSTGSFRIETRKGGRKQRTVRARSNELPLVGGPVMVLAIVVAGVAAGVELQLSNSQWTLLAILLLAMLGFGAVGFVDDWRKVHRGEGISEIQKFAGVFIIALLAAVALNRLIVTPHLSARLAYPPYSDIPLLGHVLVKTKFAWIIFFLLMTVTVASATSLAVDFSDGMDGLAGGLLLSAALSFAAILLGEGSSDFVPAVIVVLALAGALLGFLPYNWPSSWKARNQGRGKRRAVLIMGDAGSLALGGLLALVAVISRLEFVLIFIGGVFVLEGVSALVSARILVRFFRRFLSLERYGSGRGFAHTEFPLPFLATPMHHHYDLLGWDRKRLVYGGWLLGAGLGVLGVASVIGTFTWERYLARFAALIVILVVWQSGPWTRSYFIGLAHGARDSVDAPRRLALFYGFPFKLFGRRLFSLVDITDVGEHVLATPAERLSLWQRMSVFDTRAVLGYYCYRAGAFEDALRIWSPIPATNLQRRPEITEMLTEVRHSLALEADGAFEVPAGDSGARASMAPPAALPLDPGATVAAQTLLQADPAESQWRIGAPPAGRLHAAHLEPTSPDAVPAVQPASSLWSATAWTTARGSDAVPASDTPEPTASGGIAPSAGAGNRTDVTGGLGSETEVGIVNEQSGSRQ